MRSFRITASLLFLFVSLSSQAQVVINEIHFDPADKTSREEFIELFNAGTGTVDVGGAFFDDGIDFTIPSGTTMSPGSYLVVAQDPVRLQERFGVYSIGPFSGGLKNSGEQVRLRGAGGNTLDEVTYSDHFPWPTAAGGGGSSMELMHPGLDNELGGSWRSSSLTNAPTPGAPNTAALALANDAPPQIRQVEHLPEQPASNQAVMITAKITDLTGMGPVTLFYQTIDPGAYLALTDPGYTNHWIALPMNDRGVAGDEMEGDSIYTAVLPAALQQHRRLVRYRIAANDAAGASVTVPYPDDPQPNFAYFCYDGIPAWQAAVQPGTTPVLDFSTNIMRRLPALHFISKNNDVETATWYERYTGDLYKWSGTLVFDGKVYDHIHYRARGGHWRYAMCKNMWKFDFNRGHDFQMRDDYGKKYGTKWTKLNLGACIQQADGQHRGEQGMFESVGSRLFNLAGVDSFKTAFLQLRIIDDAQEATANQYEGDFWGLYLAVEQEDGRFLDEHELPDGNFYKMEGGSGELSNTGPLGPTDKSDLNAILNNYTGATDAWWEANWNLDRYYSYQAIVQAIHHYDINSGKNFFYYHNPETGLWTVVPWDLDLTWADNMYKSSWGGLNALASRILEASASNDNLALYGTARPGFRIEFRNRVREIRDLLFNAEQTGQLIDEQARLLRDPGTGSSFLDADRAMWDYNPKMNSDLYSSSPYSKAGTGRFYQWPLEPEVSQDFEGCVQLMKNYVETRGTILDELAADASIPVTPYIAYVGAAGYPLNGLVFQCSGFFDPQGIGTFAAMQWRAGEVLDLSAPAYDPTDEPPYEVTAKWESGELPTFNSTVTLPADALKVGHAYRVRVRMKDNTGRWSHWSAPVGFVCTESSAADNARAYLRISELMYAPEGDCEYIELHNTSTTTPLELDGVTFTSGIDFSFPTGTTLAPDGYVLVIAEDGESEFRSHYELPDEIDIAGTYSGKLSNDGEQITLKTAPGGTVIASFEYGTGRLWPLAAAGSGHSLVPLTHEGQASGALDYPGNWRASAYRGGSPGEADPNPPAQTLVLNEITAHTDYANPSKPEYDSDDWIELQNLSSAAVNLTGWYLSDDPAKPSKWACPSVNLPAGGILVFGEVEDFHHPITTGFGLDKAGEQVLLSYLPGSPADRVVDAIGFKGQENGRSLSRLNDYWVAAAPSRETANALPGRGLRIAEIMYHPAPLGTNDNTRDEYIEILNPTASNITMQTDGEAWRIDGGVAYTFPDDTPVPAGGTVLVVGFDPADTATSNAFATAYGLSGNVRMFGPWSGKLSNRSERIGLERPQQPDFVGDDYSWVVEDETVYGNQSPFPSSAAGTSRALERLLFNHSGLDPANWISAIPSPGETSPSPFADQDGDGMSDYDEWVCGTNPNDASSRLQFRVEASNGPDLSWGSVSGRTYSIYWTDNLTRPFVPIATNLAYPVTNFTDTGSVTNPLGFYRLDINRE